MADVVTEINGQSVTLIDNGDTTYRIDLNTSAARSFIRNGELAQLRALRSQLQDERAIAENGRVRSIAQKDAFVATKADLATRIDATTVVIDVLVAWLQGQGDVT